MSVPTFSARLLTWDWKEQLDLDDLREVLADLSGGAIRLIEIDTGNDQFAILISNAPLTEKHASDAYNQYRNAGTTRWTVG